jgi:cytochrome c biogenesis protein CcmG/thiol:disulfide interchange protein DsbE
MSVGSLGTALLGLVVLGALTISYLQSPGDVAVRAAGDRKSAPDFALKDISGAEVRLSGYRGRVVLLNFWASWCGPCNVEIPWFNEFENAYKERGFSVVGVSLDEGGWKTVKPYIEQMKLRYRIVIGDDSLARKYGGVDALPTTFLIDREGRIAASHIGLVGKAACEKEIAQLLAN